MARMASSLNQPAPPPDNEQLLRVYRAELESIGEQIGTLEKRRSALTSIVRGLAILVEKADPTIARSPRPLPGAGNMPTIIAAAAALRRVFPERPRSASEIVELMTEFGRPVTLNAMYKALRRDIERSHGLFFRDGNRFGLREWPTKENQP